MASLRSVVLSGNRFCRNRMEPRTEQAAARVSGSDKADWTARSASSSLPASTRIAAFCNAWLDSLPEAKVVHRNTKRQKSGARAHHILCLTMQFVSQLTITEGRRDPAHPETGPVTY